MHIVVGCPLSMSSRANCYICMIPDRLTDCAYCSWLSTVNEQQSQLLYVWYLTDILYDTSKRGIFLPTLTAQWQQGQCFSIVSVKQCTCFFCSTTLFLPVSDWKYCFPIFLFMYYSMATLHTCKTLFSLPTEPSRSMTCSALPVTSCA